MRSPDAVTRLEARMRRSRYLSNQGRGSVSVFCRPNQPGLSPPTRLSRLARAAIMVAGCLAMSFSVQAHAAVMPGDHFLFHWNETSPDPSLSGEVDLTVGAPIPPPPPPYFSISPPPLTPPRALPDA